MSPERPCCECWISAHRRTRRAPQRGSVPWGPRAPPRSGSPNPSVCPAGWWGGIADALAGPGVPTPSPWRPGGPHIATSQLTICSCCRAGVPGALWASRCSHTPGEGDISASQALQLPWAPRPDCPHSLTLSVTDTRCPVTAGSVTAPSFPAPGRPSQVSKDSNLSRALNKPQGAGASRGAGWQGQHHRRLGARSRTLGLRGALSHH